MLKKIKTILRYALKPAYLIEVFKNPGKIIKFFQKDLIIEPENFLVALTGEKTSAFKKYIEKINQKKDFQNYIWQEYKNFQKKLVDEKKAQDAGGTSQRVGIILYSLVRLIEPEVVLETGVASGISSAYVLAALAENKKGKLISIDLPYEVHKKYPENYIKEEGKTFIPQGKTPGWLIPEDLKDRWQLILGRSSEKLSETLNRLKEIDIFIHDSEHSYGTMTFEYQTIWPYLKKGGILFSHDVTWNRAFDDFCQKVQRKGVKYREEFGGIKK